MIFFEEYTRTKKRDGATMPNTKIMRPTEMVWVSARIIIIPVLTIFTMRV